ncbi:MAG: choice-of-anchor J domain-containing protein [Gemmatimonadales bacterium]
MPAGTMLRRSLLGAGAAALVLSLACSDDDGPGGPSDDSVLLRWTFGEDLEGWSEGTTPSASSWGTVVVTDADALDDPSDADEGSAKLDGVGDPGSPNAWIHHADLELPADATTLAWWAAGHNRDGANAALRVQLVDGNGDTHLLADWEEFTGSEGVRNWEERSVSVAAYAGQTVALYFEQDDNGPGVHEQIYLDEIRVLRD